MLPGNCHCDCRTNTHLEKNKEVFNSTGSFSGGIFCLCFVAQCLLCPDYSYQPHCCIKPLDGSLSCNIFPHRCFPVSSRFFGRGCRQHSLRHQRAEETSNWIILARALNSLARGMVFYQNRCYVLSSLLQRRGYA